MAATFRPQVKGGQSVDIAFSGFSADAFDGIAFITT